MATVYEYVAILKPTEAERKQGKRAMIVVPPTVCVADTADEARVLGARAIPGEHAAVLDRCEVLVRPFAKSQ